MWDETGVAHRWENLWRYCPNYVYPNLCHTIYKGKDCINDVWQAPRIPDQIWGQAFLGEGLLCSYCRECRWRDHSKIYLGTGRKWQIRERKKVVSSTYGGQPVKMVCETPSLAASALCPGGANLKLLFQIRVIIFYIFFPKNFLFCWV